MVLRMAVSHVLLSDDQGLLQLYINTSEYVLSYRFDLGSVSADVASGVSLAQWAILIYVEYS